MSDRSSVMVLGGSGMTGYGVLEHLASRGFRVAATARVPEKTPAALRGLFSEYEVESHDLGDLLAPYHEGDFVINTLGLIKHHIDDADSRDRETAVRVNALFPYELASIAERQGFRVLQIVTDCVYSGSRGGYTEDDKHDATDVYGQTKSLGEVPSAAVLKLRCSVIGPEHSSQVNLMAWVLSHADGTAFNGYTDHIWNGLTTLAFARMIEGIIVSDNPISGTVHVEPRGSISKYELARLILSAYGRTEVEVLPVDTGARVDRTIATLHPEINDRLWRDAGYSAIPTIEELVRELARAAGHTLDGDDA